MNVDGLANISAFGHSTIGTSERSSSGSPFEGENRFGNKPSARAGQNTPSPLKKETEGRFRVHPETGDIYFGDHRVQFVKRVSACKKLLTVFILASSGEVVTRARLHSILEQRTQLKNIPSYIATLNKELIRNLAEIGASFRGNIIEFDAVNRNGWLLMPTIPLVDQTTKTTFIPLSKEETEGRFWIHPETEDIYCGNHQAKFSKAPTKNKLMAVFIVAAGQVITRDELHKALGRNIRLKSVSTYVSELRKESGAVIEMVGKNGWRFTNGAAESFNAAAPESFFFYGFSFVGNGEKGVYFRGGKLPLSKPQRKILVTILRARGETLSQYILAEGLYGPLGGGMLKYVRQYISDMRRQLRTVGLDEQIVEAITSGEHLAEYRIQISKIPEKTFEPFFKEKNECFLEWRRMAALQLAQARTNVKESAIAAETASDPQVAIHAAAVQPVAPSNAQAPGTGSENPSKSSERLAAEKEKRQFFERQIPSLIPRLRRYALARTRDSDKTDDLVQEALTRGLARLHLWRDGTSLEAWLITILRNEYVNGVRQAVRRGQSIPVEDVESSFAVAGNQLMTVQLKEVRRYLAELPEEQRDVILLVGQEGMSHEHVAEVLGVAVGTVCSRLFRGREQLSQLTAYGRETKHSGKISSRPEVTVEDRMSTEEAVTYGAVSVHPGFNNTIDWERLSVDDHFLWQSYVAEKPSAGRPRELVPA